MLQIKTKQLRTNKNTNCLASQRIYDCRFMNQKKGGHSLPNIPDGLVSTVAPRRCGSPVTEGQGTGKAGTSKNASLVPYVLSPSLKPGRALVLSSNTFGKKDHERG